MSFFIETAKNSNQYYSGTNVNDVILRTTSNVSRIHIGTSNDMPGTAALVVDNSNVAIRGDAVIGGDIVLTNNIALAGLSLYPADSNTPDSAIVSGVDSWFVDGNLIYSAAGKTVEIDGPTMLRGIVTVGEDGGVYMTGVGSNIGLGTSNPVERLHVDGNVYANSVVTPSDALLKENVIRIRGAAALDAISSLNGYTFTYIDDLDKKVHSGVLAQEVQRVIPHVVSETGIGFKTVAYPELIAYLIECIKELRAEIVELKQKN